MGEHQKIGERPVQACTATALGALIVLLGTKFFPLHADVVAGISAVITPVVSLYIAKWYAANNEPQGLISYKARLRRDMKNQLAVLKDKRTSDSTKLLVQQKYDETQMKYATANQDYEENSLSVQAEGI